MNRDEFAELSAGYALGALSPDDERIYITALLAHPEWEDVAAADADTVAILANAVPEVSTPLNARGSILSLIARTPQDGAAARSHTTPPASPGEDDGALTSVIEHAVRHKDTEAPHPAPPLPIVTPPADSPVEADVPENPTISFLIPGVHGPSKPAGDDVEEPPTNTDTMQTVVRHKWMRGMFALAASLVFLVALGFGAALVGQQISRPASVVALDRIEDAPDAQVAAVALEGGGEATAHWSASLGQAVLVSEGLPALTSDQTYQLWFVRDEAAISAGTFTASARETTTLMDGDVEAGDVIAVTVEPAGGSDAPTTQPIIAIPTVV